MDQIANTQTGFDYNGLDTRTTGELQGRGETIRNIQDKVRQKSSDGAINIGGILKAAQELLANHGNGTFQKWVKAECGISPKTAYNAIDAFNVFGGKDCETVTQSFDVSALYALSSDSCPEEATQAAIELAETGEKITKKRANEIIAEVKQPDEEPDEEPDDIDTELADDSEYDEPDDNATNQITHESIVNAPREPEAEQPNEIGAAKDAIRDFISEQTIGKPLHFCLAIADCLDEIAEELRG